MDSGPRSRMIRHARCSLVKSSEVAARILPRAYDRFGANLLPKRSASLVIWRLLSRDPAVPGLRLQNGSGAATRAAIPQPRPPPRRRQPSFRFIPVAIGAIERVGHLHRRSRRIADDEPQGKDWLGQVSSQQLRCLHVRQTRLERLADRAQAYPQTIAQELEQGDAREIAGPDALAEAWPHVVHDDAERRPVHNLEPQEPRHRCAALNSERLHDVRRGRDRLHPDDPDLGLITHDQVGDGLRAGAPNPGAHETASPAMANDEPLTREYPQRPPDRRPADPELVEQLHLGGDRAIAFPLARLDPRPEHPLDLQVARHARMICNLTQHCIELNTLVARPVSSRQPTGRLARSWSDAPMPRSSSVSPIVCARAPDRPGRRQAAPALPVRALPRLRLAQRPGTVESSMGFRRRGYR